jgi:hypothetical protein
MTFSRDARIVAGIQSAQRLVVFELPEGRQLTSWSGTPAMLGVSPKGSFVLFIETSNSEANTADQRKGHEHINLLSLTGDVSRLWSTQSTDLDDDRDIEMISLSYFYNNGGLTAFSDNEAILVLCIPTAPEWQLLAFDLTSHDIVSSRWTIDYSCLLGGANILSLSFCPVHESRLYVLDNYGILSKVETSKKSTASLVTTGVDDQTPIIVTVSKTSKLLIMLNLRE